MLKTLQATPGFEKVKSLGIATDADDDPKARFASICSALEAVQISAPPFPGALSSGSPATAAYIFPDNANAGCLETLCAQFLRAKPIWNCIQSLLECAEIPAIPTSRRDKSGVYAYIATLKKADWLIGQAAGAGIFDWNNPAFKTLQDFLRIVGGCVATETEQREIEK